MNGTVPMWARIGGIVAILVALFLAGSTVSKAGNEEESLETLAARCRTLRAEALADVDRQKPELRHWDGELHRLMVDVGERVAKQRCSTEMVRELLGPPDKLVEVGGFYASTHVPPGEAHWVYWWRGGHDYLYFVIRKGRVAEAKWWFAGE